VESSHGRRIDLGDGRIPQHQVPGLPTISKPWVSTAYLVFLKSNLGTRFHLRGVGFDASSFYLTLIAGQSCWQWSNRSQPGSSPRKPHQPTLVTLLIKSIHMCGQALVKSRVKPYLNPSDLECFPELLPRSPNFTSTLQNLPIWKLSSLLRDTTFM
jgi:hypothetical protein